MLIYERKLHKRIGALSQLGAEKIAFPPKSDGWTDISIYRVASLLKILNEPENDIVEQLLILFLHPPLF